MKEEREKTVRFREPSTNLLGRFLSWFGIELNQRYELGYFHQFGHSGKQKDNRADIAIIEKTDGRVVCVPKKDKYFSMLDGKTTHPIRH